MPRSAAASCGSDSPSTGRIWFHSRKVPILEPVRSLSTNPIRRPKLKILVVLTSHADLGDTGRKTGFWLEELAAPYYVFKDAGADITLASPAGG